MALKNLELGGDPKDPFIDVEDIQGDILIGLQKKAEAFVAFSIADRVPFLHVLAQMAGDGTITSTEVVRQRENAVAVLKKNRNATLLRTPGVNIGFTHRGLQCLLDKTYAAAQGPSIDPSFMEGAHAQARAAALGDDLARWKEPFRSGDVDGMLLITEEDEPAVNALCAKVISRLGGSIAPKPYVENGRVRAPQPGHEHFGFADGISQPGVRGLSERQNKRNPDQGLPGQDLLWPGEFVFGYSGQAAPAGRPATAEEEGPKAEPPLPWMKNGSYMVWRRLEQKVLAFRETRDKEALALAMDPKLFESRMVGRWPSGAPLVLRPLQDDLVLGGEPSQNNDFEYQGDDPHQRKCPYAAHIRKVYPRDDLNGASAALGGESGEAEVQTHRIIRAGIPFGFEVEDEETAGNEKSRGLMFVCYQTSIVEQFEFVQQSWANKPDFVSGKVRPNTSNPVQPGLDPIIGQGAPRVMDEPIPNYPAGNRLSQTSDLPPFIQSTAGVYLFMPSIPALLTGFKS